MDSMASGMPETRSTGGRKSRRQNVGILRIAVSEFTGTVVRFLSRSSFRGFQSNELTDEVTTEL